MAVTISRGLVTGVSQPSHIRGASPVGCRLRGRAWLRSAPSRLRARHRRAASRSLGVQALERAGRPYRVTCAVRGVLGVVAAARAGLGVAVFARSLLPGDLVELPASAGLPDVGAIDLTLLTNPRSATEPAEALTAAILASGHPVKSRQD